MKPLSSRSRIGHDTTPATHGDLEVWGGRLLEVMEENKQELKVDIGSVKSELGSVKTGLGSVKNELKSVKAELKAEIGDVRERVIRLEDRQNDTYLLVKAIEKKISKK